MLPSARERRSTVTRISTMFTALILLLTSAAAFAQEVRNEPRAIVVNPSPSFGVSVFLNKDGEVPTYRIGEEIRISVRVDRQAFVYLFSIQPDGSVTQILPNRFSDDNRLEAGETRTYPPQNAGYVYNVEPPTGLSKVVAVASTRELDTRELARFQNDAAFATSDIGESGFQSAFRIVVNPVPQSGWVTATTYYEVQRSGDVSRPSQATLAVESDPSGADVYLDGSFQGTTPLRFTSQPGRRTIRIERSGYETYQTTVRLSPGESRRIDPDLQRIRRTGSVRFESSPSGAEVYVNGSYQGTTPIGSTVLDAGSYEVRFELSGYGSETAAVRVDAGSQQTVRRTLAPLRGSLRITANVGGAQAFLNGRSVGTIASGSGRLDVGSLEPGRYQITLVAPGFQTVVQTVEIFAGDRTEVRLRQERR